jgi:hypothetical protein
LYYKNPEIVLKPKPKLPTNVKLRDLIVFDSNFESGNLDSAYLHSYNHYCLLLKVDTNTKGQTHWFYFKV